MVNVVGRRVMTPFSVPALPCVASTFFREVTEPLVLTGEHRKGGRFLVVLLTQDVLARTGCERELLTGQK